MLALVIRMVIALAVVIAIMMVAARVMRKKLGTTITSRSRSLSIETIARQPLTRSSSIAVVRIGNRNLVLGITESQVSNICEIDHIDLESTLESGWTTPPGDESTNLSANHSSQSWKGMLEQLREATARRS